RPFSLLHPPPSESSTLSLHDALPIWVRATSGAEFSLTPDHKVLVDTPDGPAMKPAETLSPGESIYSAKSLAIPGSEPTILDLLRSEEHTSELQSRENLVCRLLLEKKK